MRRAARQCARCGTDNYASPDTGRRYQTDATDRSAGDTSHNDNANGAPRGGGRHSVRAHPHGTRARVHLVCRVHIHDLRTCQAHQNDRRTTRQARHARDASYIAGYIAGAVTRHERAFTHTQSSSRQTPTAAAIGSCHVHRSSLLACRAAPGASTPLTYPSASITNPQALPTR